MINLSHLKWQLLKPFLMLMRIRMVFSTHQSARHTWKTTFTSRARETQNTWSAKETLRTCSARGSLDEREKKY